jgi:hypothetical protein
MAKSNTGGHQNTPDPQQNPPPVPNEAENTGPKATDTPAAGAVHTGPTGPAKTVSQEADPTKDKNRSLPRAGGDQPASGQDAKGSDDPLKDVPASPSPNPQDSSLQPRPGVGGTTLEAAHPEQFGPPPAAGPTDYEKQLAEKKKAARGGPVYQVRTEWIGGPPAGSLVTKEDLGEHFSYREHLKRGTVVVVDGMEEDPQGGRSTQDEVDRLHHHVTDLREEVNANRRARGLPQITDWDNWHRGKDEGPF